MAGFAESQPSENHREEPADEDFEWEIGFFKGIVETSPEYVDALVNLANLYTRCGLYEQGLEMDRRLARLCPDDAIIRYNLACSLSLLENVEESLDELEKAIKLGYKDYHHMLKDDDLRNVRHERRFEELASVIRP